MHTQVDMLPVVETSSTHCLVIDIKAERPYKMKPRSRCQGEPPHSAGIGRDLRLYKHDVQSYIVIA